MATAAANIRHWLTPRRWRSLAGALSRALQWRASSGSPQHPFDRAHGVDTDGLIYADRLSSGHAHDRHSAGYYATAPSLFRGAMLLWGETLAGSGYLPSDYSLVDIGCGKGRVVMMASEYAFREVAGVELNPSLAAVARKNLRRWLRLPRACKKVGVVIGDALSILLPDGPVVLFFFNSFEHDMAEMWLERLGHAASARAHPLDLIYVHPEFDSLARRIPRVQVVAETGIRFSPEDTAADVFGVGLDHCVVYRLRGGRGKRESRNR